MPVVRKLGRMATLFIASWAVVGCQVKITPGGKPSVDIIVAGAAPGETSGETNQPELPPREVVTLPDFEPPRIRASAFVAPTVNPSGMSTSPTLRPGD